MVEEEETQINREFPIMDYDDLPPMKNINPVTFPNFHGLSLEDTNIFIFEFEVVCRTYDYISDAKKLKLFPSTLKDTTLRWFVSLEANNINTWEQMKDAFMERYRDYCKSKDTREDIFRMTQEKNETLEYFEERLQLSCKRSHSCTVDDDSLKTILLQGLREEYLDTLNLLAYGDICCVKFLLWTRGKLPRILSL